MKKIYSIAGLALIGIATLLVFFSLAPRPLPAKDADPKAICARLAWKHSEVWMMWFGPSVCKVLLSNLSN